MTTTSPHNNTNAPMSATTQVPGSQERPSSVDEAPLVEVEFLQEQYNVSGMFVQKQDVF